MTSKFDTKEYLAKRDFLKKRFEVEKTGEQTLFTNQEKLLKPLIESQKESSKAITNTNQEILSNALEPLKRELQKRNDQLEALQDLPFYNMQQGIEDVPQSTPQKEKDLGPIIDLNARLNTTDFENLEDMELLKPNEVREDGNINEVLRKIESINRSNGQKNRYLKDPKEKDILNSRKETLVKYKQTILDIKNNEIYVKKSGKGLRKICKQKRGRGRPKMYPDTIFYNNASELCEKLSELDASKQAGNTGLDNVINSVLDELLNIKSINKDEYDKLYKNIFN
jgi:hypothetical protein